MKLLPLLSAGLVFAAAGCNATRDTNTHDHWNLRGMAPDMGRNILGYDAERDGRYIDFQYERKHAIDLTLKRHFLNQNPENPFQPEDKEFYAPRPPHSILPRPWSYIHVEGVVFALTSYAFRGGLPIPIPIDSLIGTFSEGGDEEFADGLRETFGGGSRNVRSASFLHESIGFEIKPVPVAK